MQKPLYTFLLPYILMTLSAQNKANIAGLITDANGNPMKGAELSILYTNLTAASS